jgi:tricorn protease
MRPLRPVASLAFLLAAAPLLAANPGYYRSPVIHGDSIVFVAEGDLWRVPVAGGVAQRLTSHPGQETLPAISPDGLTVAFSAAYEGPTEVYTMPIAGGLPTRLTWEGRQASVVGWTPDGKVLYATEAFSTLPQQQLVTIDPASGARTVLPLAQASDGCYDAPGGTLFFTRLPFQGSHTKRYRGGMAQNLWRLSPGDSEAKPLTADFAGTSKAPMWWQGRLYFVSDRDGTMNLWSMRPDGGDLVQHTRHDGWDVTSPTLSDGRIAYKLGADIRVFDIASGADSPVAITLASDFDQLREKWVDKPIDYLTSASLSPDGGRVALTARGEVFVVPTKQGRLVDVTRRDGVRYREAHFMPDGKSLVALSDESGEVEWWRLPANGVGDTEQLTADGKVLRFDGVPSPDGTKIAYWDKDLELWIFDIAAKRATRVATSPHWGFGAVSWSPDSRFLAYGVPAPNTFTQIEIYSVADGTSRALTSARTESDAPVWSQDGGWIYFLSDRSLESAVPSPWGPRQPEPFVDTPTRLYAVALKPGLRFPFAPDDELKPAEADKDDDKGAKDEVKGKKGAAEGKEKKGEPEKASVTIEPAGLADRLFEVPVDAGRFADLAGNKSRLFWLSYAVDDDEHGDLLALDISNDDPTPKTLVEDVDSFQLSANGEKLLVRKGDNLYVLKSDAGEKADLKDAKVDLSSWRFAVRPREEFRQMFREAWRLERDYFYDTSMHGVDWPAMLAKYQPLVDRVADRAELSDLLAQMVSELSALHIFVYGGDVRKGKDDIAPARLGAVLERDEAAGGWRVRHVYRGDPDYPGEWSPLARPEVAVHEGDVITSINGAPTLPAADPAALLRGDAGRQALLHVKPGVGAERDVIVTPITPAAEADLRYAEWGLTRREHVDAAGGGAIGYVHLRAMGGDNWTEWERNFYPVFDRSGLIIDVRHNRGGNIDSWILEKLLRKAWFYWQPRRGLPTWNMQFAFRGHMVVLVDQRTASDGEAFAEGFRRLGLGKVIGARTWGGEIWLSSSNTLVDKGIATAAETGVYGPEGEWLIEGNGVVPDIAVDDLPRATFDGADAQLDAAIRYLQEQIRTSPVPPPSPPPYPDKSDRRHAATH